MTMNVSTPILKMPSRLDSHRPARGAVPLTSRQKVTMATPIAREFQRSTVTPPAIRKSWPANSDCRSQRWIEGQPTYIAGGPAEERRVDGVGGRDQVDWPAVEEFEVVLLAAWTVSERQEWGAHPIAEAWSPIPERSVWLSAKATHKIDERASGGDQSADDPEEERHADRAGRAEDARWRREDA